MGSCRYMRATQLRWPLRLLSRGRAVDLVNLELKAALVNGDYAVVTVDVRGTGGLQRAWLVFPCGALSTGYTSMFTDAVCLVITEIAEFSDWFPPANSPH